MRLTTLTVLFAALWTAPCLHAQETAVTKATFDRTVAPLLTSRCLDCHSGRRPKGGLDLSRRAGLLEGGDTGKAIMPGAPEKSLLWQMVEQGKMPPRRSLSAAEKALLRAWITAGAPWGSDPIDPFRHTTAHRAGYDWWSLRPVTRPEPPAVGRADWPRNAVDRFVLARLEKAGLAPAPRADRRTLIRRLSFDLLGLPPTPVEIDAFVRDERPDAYERLVDRLLASPQYGARWARHWLDVVRYAESDGFERNMPRTTAWRYRDWVIAALNRDLPYDEFARLQIAGDVLRPGEADAVSATGFLVAGVHNTVVGQSVLMQRTARQDELEDMAATLGQAFLGLTVHCARCHDHKFDPVSMTDYYRLTAALAGVQHGERVVAATASARRKTALQALIAARDTQRAALERTVAERLVRRRPAATEPPLPVPPLARWNFKSDGRDTVGTLHATLKGGAAINGGRLRLNGAGAFAVTATLPRALRERTLEAWVSLATLKQGGGSVIGIETIGGRDFDAIVFAERRPLRWMAGSDFFRRTRDLNGIDEDAGPDRLVHVAAAYHADGRIAVYRDGQPYAPAYTPASGLKTYPAGRAHVLFGLRHTGSRGYLAGSVAEARLYDRALTAAEIRASAQAGPAAAGVTAAEIEAELTPAERAQRERLQAERVRLTEELAALPGPVTVFAVRPAAAPPTHVLARGDVAKPRERVAAGGVAALSGADFGLAPDAPEAERRRKLADWITRPDNPLFARVIVNRLWQHHLGAGLVETPSDFGFSGGRPSHPELLDWLASELARQRWSLKALHRVIVTSSTYRQASAPNARAAAIDVNNRLLWRQAPRRLEGEALRDALLTVAGRLNRAMGGPGYHDVRTYHNSGTTYYEPIDPAGPAFERRTIYRFAPRGERSTLLETFDCPDPSAAAPRRQVTTTPLQALALLNSSFALRMADHLAERVEASTKAGSAAAKAACAYRLALGRAATTEELRRAAPFVERHGLSALCRVLFNSNEFVIID